MYESNEITLIEGAPIVKLPQNQSAALAVLTGGGTITAAAVVAGVDRSTIHRWLRSDERFRQVLNEQRAQATTEARLQLSALTLQAVETIADAIRQGDARIAMTILNRQKLFDPAGE
jgi:transposase-like protein